MPCLRIVALPWWSRSIHQSKTSLKRLSARAVGPECGHEDLPPQLALDTPMARWFRPYPRKPLSGEGADALRGKLRTKPRAIALATGLVYGTPQRKAAATDFPELSQGASQLSGRTSA
jgi:hypothetical protein